MWTNRFRSNPPTPANTSKTVGRTVERVSIQSAQSFQTQGSAGVFDRLTFGQQIPLGPRPVLAYPPHIHENVMGESRWSFQDTVLSLWLRLPLWVVPRHRLLRRSCQNLSMTSSARHNFRRKSACRLGKSPLPPRKASFRPASRAASPAPSLMAARPQPPMLSRPCQFAFPFRAGNLVATNPVVANLVAGNLVTARLPRGRTSPAQPVSRRGKISDAAQITLHKRFSRVSDLGLTPNRPYCCPLQSTGGISC